MFSFLFVNKIDSMLAIRESNTHENNSRDTKYVVLSWNILYILYKIKYYFMKMIIMIFGKHIIEEIFNYNILFTSIYTVSIFHHDLKVLWQNSKIVIYLSMYILNILGIDFSW